MAWWQRQDGRNGDGEMEVTSMVAAQTWLGGGGRSAARRQQDDINSNGKTAETAMTRAQYWLYGGEMAAVETAAARDWIGSSSGGDTRSTVSARRNPEP